MIYVSHKNVTELTLGSVLGFTIFLVITNDEKDRCVLKTLLLLNIAIML